jgi:hypothetical protein
MLRSSRSCRLDLHSGRIGDLGVRYLRIRALVGLSMEAFQDPVRMLSSATIK